jgi:hypothetical protein
MRASLVAPIAALLTALAYGANAAPADWIAYGSAAKGFIVRFPERPFMTSTIFPIAGGTMAPATIYESDPPSAQLTLTVVDFTGGGDVALAQRLALRGLRAEGTVQRDADLCVSGQVGRELWLVGADGGQWRALVFVLGQRLFMLEAKTAPPNADPALANAQAFEASLAFPAKPQDAPAVCPAQIAP